MHAGLTCVGEDETLRAAAQTMRDLSIGALPICGKDDRLHGIITDRDIVVKCVAASCDPAVMTAGELAQGTTYTIDANAGVDQVLQTMEDHCIHRLPVLDHDRVLGMISEADLARHLSGSQVGQFVEVVTLD
ncbi:CBS domain-containing protein [Actinopolymorpha pittospori]|uniref:CBS domain-containing protein n=1 Tax=Actinopolymorpha pittospori TaxID=648752 RepID=A0A927MV40_9ACTN|nr:CBS domain-containing protein [Actinopolymorpha pittospori]MBE1603865.1 CBS domain-containing protein [Actinopolymorpha pittospori]